jgi:hypothetical protein
LNPYPFQKIFDNIHLDIKLVRLWQLQKSS